MLKKKIKKKKNHFAEKSHSVFKGLKRGPFKHTKTFFLLQNVFFNFFSTFIKNIILQQFITFFTKNMQVKKEKLLTTRSSNCSISAKFFPILVKTPYFEGVINQKTYLNHELDSTFFFLSSLAYKLVNLLVFEEKNHIK